jgi:hypothetical protein
MTINLLQRLIVCNLVGQEQGSPLEARMTILRSIKRKLALTAEHAKEYSFEPLPGQVIWYEKQMEPITSEIELDEKEQKLLALTLGKCERMSVIQAETLESLMLQLGMTL